MDARLTSNRIVVVECFITVALSQVSSNQWFASVNGPHHATSDILFLPQRNSLQSASLTSDDFLDTTGLFSQQDDFLVRTIELGLNPNAGVDAVGRPTAGVARGELSQRDDVQHR
jgi:hypothetical protein